MARMKNQELVAVLGAQWQSAKNYQEVEVGETRHKARQYYRKEPFGNEIEDRSQVILTEVRDKIGALMPALMKIFTSGDEVVRFEPVGPEDRALAQQATDYTNHVLMKENNGFSILHDYMHDALLEGLGVTRVFVEDIEREENETRVVLADELARLADEYDDFEIIEETESDDGLVRFKVEVSRTIERSKICVECLDPNDFYVEDTGSYIQDLNYLSYRSVQVKADLIEQGFDKKKVMDLPSFIMDTREIETDATGSRPPPPSPSMEQVEIHEHYVRMDMDGKTKRWKIVTGGDVTVILDKTEWTDDWPFQVISPTPIPHEFYGSSLAEELFDVQLINSTLLRSLLDNLYSINNNRVIVREISEGDVDLDAVLDKRLDGVIRVRGEGSGVEPMPIQPIGDAILPGLEYMSQVAELRTGVTKFGEGLEPDTLQRSSASGVSLVMSAALDKQQLIARIFAETGIKDIFIAIYKLARKYQAAERIVRLRGEFVPVEPGRWGEEYDLTVNVGLGTGNRLERSKNAMTLFQLVVQAFQGGMTDVEGMYNAFEEALRAMGFRSAEPYVPNPKNAAGQQRLQQIAAQKEKKADSAMEKIKADAQIKVMDIQRKAEADKAKLMADMQTKSAELQLKSQENQQRQAIDREQMTNDFFLERDKVVEDIKTDRQKLQQDLLIEMRKMMIEAQSEMMELNQEAQLKQLELALQAALKDKEINIRTNIRDPGD